ncbi:hypothetical protein Tco_0321246 [Tanacetum coccineum]
MNLALHTEGKKKVNPLVIPGVCFTKLIINHLQSIHKFHKRPGSPLHLPYEEAALGYLKFSFKNTKRVRFGMAIPNTLIFEDIRSAPYYPEYVAKVTKYQCYLTGEVVSDDEAPAPKPGKGAKRKTPRKPNRNLLHHNHPNPNQHLLSLGKRKESWLWKPLEHHEGVSADEPRFEDEETDTIQKVMEESLKDAYPAPRGPLPPMVIREPKPRKYEPLPKRRTPVPTIPSIHEESSSMYVELGLTDSKLESDNEASREGQAGSDPGKLVEGQAGSDPGVVADSQIQPSHVMDKEFTTAIYPNVQENLKLPTEGEVRLEEPESSNGTLSSLQNLDKDLSFTNQFLAEKSQPDEPKKTNNEMKVQSMVMVPIHQDTSSVHLMTMPVIDLTVSQLASITIQASIPTSTTTVTTTTTTTTTTFPPPPHQPQQGISDSIYNTPSFRVIDVVNNFAMYLLYCTRLL